MQHFYAAMQMRGWVPEDILRRGITVNPGVLEFPQLIETEYDGNRLTGLYSSHVIATPKGRIWPGQYVVTLRAWGRDTFPATQMLRLTVRNDAKDPVTIQRI